MDANETVYRITDALPVGRTSYHADTQTLWCAHSGSGVSFGFRGESCVLTLTADSAYRRGTVAAVRYAVLRNGRIAAEGQLTVPEQTVTLQFEAGENGFAWVQLIKLSESSDSVMGVKDIAVRSAHMQENRLISPERKPYLIEFIGDSITCGYGVDGICGRDAYQTANENVMKTYAYLTAKQLGADYSMVCFSGYGILSGYTVSGRINDVNLVPRYYDKVGYSSGILEQQRRIQDDRWDFAVQPDAVVINLGTNDASYTWDFPELQQVFSQAYEKFLHTVREKNPHAMIVCTLGMMGETLCEAMEQAAERFRTKNGDANICTMRFDPMDSADGAAVDYHPSARTHQKAAAKLTAFLCTACGMHAKNHEQEGV